MSVDLLTAFALLAALWSVLCRVNQMQRGVTDPGVFWSHAALGLGLAGGLFLAGSLGKLSMAAGVTIYLLAGAWRWRYAAPTGTRIDSDAMPLDEVPR